MSNTIHAEARALVENEAFNFILNELSASARDALVTTPAEQSDRIRDHQAMARSVETIRERVKLLVQAGAEKPRPGLA